MPKKALSKHPKSKIQTLALLLILPLFLTACTVTDLPVIGGFLGGLFGGGDGGTTLGPANLSVWGLWENPAVVETLVQEFVNQNPEVTVNYDDRSVLKPLVDYKERVFRRATDQESAPDIMRVHVSWIPALSNVLVPAQESVMDATTFRNSFYPVAAEKMIINEQVYGMPTYYDGLVLVYNRDHFEEIGQLEAPTAWEEFRRLALELTVRGENDSIVRAGAAIGAANNIDFASDIVGMLFAQARVSIPDDVDSKAAQDALSFYTNFVLEDQVWSNEMPEASVAFSQEKASMIFVPTWNLLDIIAARPDMNIGVAAVPQALPDDPASWASFWVDVVPQASKNPDAAWAYIKFMSQSENQFLAYSEASKFRVFGAPYSLVSMAPELSTNPFVAPALETASVAQTNELASRAGNRRQVDALKTAINGLLDDRTRNTTPADVLPALKTELSR